MQTTNRQVPQPDDRAPSYHVEQWRRGGGAQDLSCGLVVHTCESAAFIATQDQQTNLILLVRLLERLPLQHAVSYFSIQGRGLKRKARRSQDFFVQDFFAERMAQMMKEALALRSEQLRHGFCLNPPAARKCRTCNHDIRCSLVRERAGARHCSIKTAPRACPAVHRHSSTGAHRADDLHVAERTAGSVVLDRGGQRVGQSSKGLPTPAWHVKKHRTGPFHVPSVQNTLMS